MIPINIYIKGLVAIALSTLLYMGYAHVKQSGYDAAREHYEEIIKEYNEQTARRLRDIEVSSSALVRASDALSDSMGKGINKILVGQKQKPLVIIKDGKCNPSETFSETFFLINSRVNQTIRESQK